MQASWKRSGRRALAAMLWLSVYGLPLATAGDRDVAVAPGAVPPEAVATSPDAATSPGCAPPGRGRGDYFAIRPANLALPLGMHVRQANEAQRLNALEEYCTIFSNEWCCGRAELGPSGRRHLEGILRRMHGTSFALKVEPDSNPYLVHLTQLRRAFLVQVLADRGFPDAEARVIIAPSAAEGLRGDDIELAGERMLRFDQRGGAYGGYGSSGFGTPFGGVGTFGSPFMGSGFRGF
jgi:hypothetical protein